MVSTHSKQRIFYYDFLRALAILCVIASHVYAIAVVETGIFNTPEWYYYLTFNSLSCIGVPMFVLISGALLIGRKDSLTAFFKKRIARVVVPYIFWMLVFILFGTICHYYNYFITFPLDQFILETVSFVPTHKSNFFWFVPMILTTYVIIFIINTINQKYKNILKISLAAALLCLILINFAVLPTQKPLSYIYYFIFSILGYYLSKFDLSRLKLDNTKLTVIFFILFLIFYIGIVITNADMSINSNKIISINQFSLLNILTVSFLFMFARCLSMSEGHVKKIYKFISVGSIGKIIYSLSLCSYGIYLSHIIVRVTLYYFFRPVNINMPVYITLLYLFTVLGSWFLIIDKKPYLKKIGSTLKKSND